MKLYEEALHDFKLEYALRAMDVANGNMCKAAAATGIHRNTMGRILLSGGFDSRRVKERLRRQRLVAGPKPPMSEAPANYERRTA